MRGRILQLFEWHAGHTELNDSAKDNCICTLLVPTVESQVHCQAILRHRSCQCPIPQHLLLQIQEARALVWFWQTFIATEPLRAPQEPSCRAPQNPVGSLTMVSLRTSKGFCPFIVDPSRPLKISCVCLARSHLQTRSWSSWPRIAHQSIKKRKTKGNWAFTANMPSSKSRMHFTEGKTAVGSHSQRKYYLLNSSEIYQAIDRWLLPDIAN